MRPIKWITLLLAILAFGRCVHEPFEPTVVPVQAPFNECHPDTVYFKRDIQPILHANCVNGCHDEQTANKGVVLESYERLMSTTEVEPGNPGETEIFEHITEDDPDKRMPPPPAAPLDHEAIELIRVWIEQGAQDLTCDYDTTQQDDTSSCVPSEVSYADHVVPILQQNGCIGCHSGGAVVLSSYADVKVHAENGRLLGAIRHEPGYRSMPD